MASTDDSGLRLRKNIVLFGDSLTQRSFEFGGWGARFQNATCRSADVICRGLSGYTTREAKEILPLFFPESNYETQKLDLVTVCFGANDAVKAGSTQHVPVDEYIANLRQILQHIRKCGKVVVVIGPPMVDSGSWPDRSNERALEYTEAAQATAELESCIFANIYKALEREPDFKNALCDGLHFNSKGNLLMFEAIHTALREAGTDVNSWAPDLPQWTEVEHENPAASLSVDALKAFHASRPESMAMTPDE